MANHHRHHILIVLVAVLGGWSSFARGEILTYESLPQLVRGQSRVVKSSLMVAQAAQSREGHLERSFLPRLESFVGSEAFRMGTQQPHVEPLWRVDTYVNVYNGDRDAIEDHLRSGTTQVSLLEAEKDFAQELLAARKAYFEALSIDQMMAIERSLFELHEGHLRRARQKLASGITTESDVLQIEIAKTMTSQQLKKLRAQSDVTKTQLALLTGIADHTQIVFKESVDHPAEDDLKGEVVDAAKIPEIHALRGRETNLNIEASKYRGLWRPQIDLYASAVQFTSRDREVRPPRERQEWALGVRLKMDLGDVWSASREAQAKSLLAAATALKADYRTSQLLALEHELRHELSLLHEMVHDADTNIEQATKVLALTLDEYDRGLKNGADILQASQNLAELKRLSAAHKTDYYLRRCDLLALLGK